MTSPAPEPLYVTRPFLPPLDEYLHYLQGIWARRWLSNHGETHASLERELRRFLRVPNLSLCNNGMNAWLLGLKAIGVDGGEAIVTPFTFPGTLHALPWLGVTPVFCDIDPVTMNLDPARIDSLVTPHTRAILAVHVYGTPCDVHGIQSVADRHGLRVAYDGAHAFGAELRDEPLARFGDITMLSFHATKLFNTAEGGCLVYRDSALREKFHLLHNFGIAGEDQVVLPGLNGKMNELQAALGLALLPHLEAEKGRRQLKAKLYRHLLEEIPGLTCQLEQDHWKSSQQYFVVRIAREAFGTDRDAVWRHLRANAIYARRYFYPLCSDFPCYRELPSARPELLPNARQVASEVLALPFYGDLADAQIERICRLILAARQA